jgi:hypothetical protein
MAVGKVIGDLGNLLPACCGRGQIPPGWANITSRVSANAELRRALNKVVVPVLAA